MAGKRIPFVGNVTKIFRAIDAQLALFSNLQGSIVPTSDGLTTGLITADMRHAEITSGNTAYIATLPDASVMRPGQQITLWNNATACKLRTPASSNTKINNVDSDGTQQVTLAANTLYKAYFVNATVGWILISWTNLGAANAAIVPA